MICCLFEFINVAFMQRLIFQSLSPEAWVLMVNTASPQASNKIQEVALGDLNPTVNGFSLRVAGSGWLPQTLVTKKI